MRDLRNNAKRILAFVLVLAMVYSGSSTQIIAAELTGTQEINTAAEAVVEEIAAEETTDDEAYTEAAAEVTADSAAVEEIGTDAVVEALTSDEAGVGVTSGDDGKVICSGLDGVKGNTDLIRATLNTTFKIKNVDGVKQSVTERVVRVTWKKPTGSDAKRYKLERMKADGSDVTELIGNTNKRVYVDKIHKNGVEDDSTYVYVVTYMDKYGTPTSDARVAAVASPSILYTQTIDDTNYARIYFTLENGPISYKVERSDSKNKDKFFTNLVADVNVSALNGAEVTSYNGTPAICVTDKTGSFALGSKHFYRVTAYVKDRNAGEEVQSLPSKSMALQAALPQPELLSITGTHEGNEVCFRNATFKFTQVEAAAGSVKKYTVLRSLYPDRGFKAIRTVAVKDMAPIDVTALDGTVKKGYEITYKNNPPQVKYYYRVRAVGKKGVAGAMSNVLSNTCQFAKVSDVQTESISAKQLNVSWKSEACALKYVIERSGPYDTTPLDGKISDFTKIATVANKNAKEGRITYRDLKKLQEGKYYYYHIYPVNGKAKGIDATSDAVEGKCIVGAAIPSAAGMNLHKINVSWKSVYGAVKYTVQRTTVTDLNGKPVFTDDSTLYETSGKDSVFKKCLYSDLTVSPSNEYFYRVLSTGANSSCNPDKARYVSAHSVPKPVANLQVAVRDTSDWSGINVKWTSTSELPNTAYYLIYRKINNGEWTAYKYTPKNFTGTHNYTWKDDVARANGRKYQYKICAVALDGTQEIVGRPTAIKKIILPSSISIESESHTMKVGYTYKIKVTGFGGSATYKRVEYGIGDTSIVKETEKDNEGDDAYITVKAQKTGKTTVTVRPRYSDGITKTCTITVQ